MPQIYPLGQPQFATDQSGKFIKLPGLELAAATLGELLRELERSTGARVVPHDPPKYFRYYASPDAVEYELVDIHVERNGECLCPKQDLGFSLLLNDKVIPGPLAC